MSYNQIISYTRWGFGFSVARENTFIDSKQL